ncbi:MAG TPA: tRNA (adenosine(37)-N6)-threonylcarbamoyltransferase complex ATPase subunit type 1 TsaE [Rhodobacteraceae bacterium]|nr:tRNA (adenosine(37)-N6)-threonylcarbamoyltransferase complex ATPase subunit type 1 TsaE [Paracoccaceae bacterium]
MEQTGTRSLTRAVADETGTAALARALAPHLAPGDALLLDGALAAGKTAFVRALAAALGSRDSVTSPTYTIANIYETPGPEILHVDAYRLKDAREFYHLGLEDYLDRAICVIEWGTRVEGMIDAPLRLHFAFGAEGESAREITLSAEAPRWAPVLEALR